MNFSVFVNNVSKRIHPSSLKEAFMEYGVVSDVFIAFRSRRRLYDKSNFAFVRFKSKQEARVAVRKADGRLMDGFKRSEQRRLRVRSDQRHVSKRFESARGGAVRTDQTSMNFYVFVNNVSKRIHLSSLKEAFMEYGVVSDVFISFRSIRRLYDKSTFAFVRFKSKQKVRVAVRKADGRLMDGFKIKVYHDKSVISKSNRI
ncbi:polyadenylate-binding protein 5-like [Hibiscus syriacus]|uniref:polyadenylate-binding protein 5-like n=1 Tax=Hibiscus syriacus TaxID=106335 RepID=UPI00192394F6|nr:polyadenylate-binding protein 5-like [Hibiscus syriacus]